MTSKFPTTSTATLALIAAGILGGCTQTPKSPEVADDIRKALDQAGLQKVSVDQDRDMGVVILSGMVAADAEKTRAESIAKSMAAGQVVSDQIAVLRTGTGSALWRVNSELDKGIEHDLDAALILRNLHDQVRYTVKNHVVTLTGEVDTDAKRREALTVAASIPYVQQVVNELHVKNQKATSSE